MAHGSRHLPTAAPDGEAEPGPSLDGVRSLGRYAGSAAHHGSPRGIWGGARNGEGVAGGGSAPRVHPAARWAATQSAMSEPMRPSPFTLGVGSMMTVPGLALASRIASLPSR